MRFLILLISLMVYSEAFAAAGGTGATCNPYEPAWGSCTIKTVPFASSVTQTINIPGGDYSSPYVANQSYTRYVLQGDITADSSGIEVAASFVIVDLNGYTITYNEVSPGEGVVVSAWNKTHIAVVNGSIIQGAARSPSTTYARGNSPISTYSSRLLQSVAVPNFYVANTYLYTWGSDGAGIVVASSNSVFEENTIVDDYGTGPFLNRTAGVAALTPDLGIIVTNVTARYNTIINAKHRGIQVGSDSQVYQNKISMLSLDTNSYGVFAWKKSNVKIYNNTMVLYGVAPIGVGIMNDGTTPSLTGIEIYDNDIFAKTTMLHTEYPGGNNAVGIRTHRYGNSSFGLDGLLIYRNEIEIEVDPEFDGIWAQSGEEVTFEGKGVALRIGIQDGEEAHVFENIITINALDESVNAVGVAFDCNRSDEMFFYNNTITSNGYNVVFGSSYCATDGYPLVIGNSFVKSGSLSAYATYANQYDNWANSTGRVVDNVYSGGAAETSVEFDAGPSGNPGIVDVYFGDLVGTDIEYSYRLHDNANASRAILQEDFDPAETRSWAVYVPGTPPVDPPENPINGVCGANDGGTFDTLRSFTDGNCTAGTVSNFSGTGPWTWVCAGINDGTSSGTCSASKTSAPVLGSGPGAYTTDSTKWPRYSPTQKIPHTP